MFKYPLPSLCFSDRSENQGSCPRPLIDWDIFDFSSKTDEQNSTKLDRKQDLNVFYQVYVFRFDIKKNKMAARLLIGFGIFDFSSETAERNLTLIDRKQDLNVCDRSENQDDRPASDWLRYFRLLLWSRWTEFKKT